METVDVFSFYVFSYYHSDPTYEAWKPNSMQTINRGYILFRSYLRGMETQTGEFKARIIDLEFRSYLRGMETISPWWGRRDKSRFRSYLRGMETILCLFRNIEHLPIPILPMRHGNREAKEIARELTNNSDPTYEAWKLDLRCIICLFGRVIPILPMRHGNSKVPGFKKVGHRFRSYLWGMETKDRAFHFSNTKAYSDPTYEAWKRKRYGS